MSEIEKMKARWQEHEQHNDTILDYAISQIYTHAKLIEELKQDLQDSEDNAQNTKRRFCQHCGSTEKEWVSDKCCKICNEKITACLERNKK